jgi:hypothetical protein
MAERNYKGIETLTGSNYTLWMRDVRRYMKGKDIFDIAIINPAPAADAALEVRTAFTSADAKCLSIIIRTMDRQNKIMYGHLETARQIWEALITRYAQRTGTV